MITIFTLLKLLLFLIALRLAVKALRARFGNVVKKGSRGEVEIEKRLSKISSSAKILKNLYIPTTTGRTTEVDLVLIDITGVYVIESKNFGGYVLGHESEVNWLQKFKGDKKQFKFYNPIFQNRGHIKALCNITNLDDFFFTSLVVFGDRCNIDRLKLVNHKSTVISLKDLKKVVSNEVRNRRPVFNNSDIEEIYTRLLHFTNVSDRVKENHNRNALNTRQYYNK